MSTFPNQAGDHPETDAILEAELRAAGIPLASDDAPEAQQPSIKALLRNASGEVKTSVFGFLHGWHFRRGWRYWVATGPGIEIEAAERLHAAHGSTVRVDGHGGAPAPGEWFKGLAVGSYHVDDAAGLQALADTIKGLVARHQQRSAVPLQELTNGAPQ